MKRGVRIARIPGPYVAGGYKTVPQLFWGNTVLTVDPDCGMDLLWIEGAPRPFLDPRVIGRVTDPTSRLAMASLLDGGLKGLSAYTQTPLAGFQSGVSSLHHGLIGQPPDDLSFWVSTSDDEVKVGANYTVGTAITGNSALAQRLAVQQTVKMSTVPATEEGPEILTISRQARYEAIVESWLYLVDHPNYYILPEDVIRFNTQGRWHVCDRDGTTPPGQNAFLGLAPEVLGRNIEERCFFGWLEPNDDDEISLLVYNPTRGSIGFTYAVSPNYPSWVMIWSSPSCDLPGLGVGSIEYGMLPLGAERCHELGLVKLLPAGDRVWRNCNISFLPTEEDAQRFASQHKIDLASENYPVEIKPDWDDSSIYDLKRCTFKTLRQAAGL
ncbi:MAG: hypothetical protein NT039_03585 [Candidatus Berkelbacteria bacterium]|nr:hypothetical protein [Candidatus Berkelbacteria bacterium]